MDGGAPGSDAVADSAPQDDAASADGGAGPDAAVGPDAGPPPPMGWSAAPPVASGPIQEDGVVAIGDRIYVVGGFAGPAPLIVPTVSVFDTVSGEWSQAADLPTRMHHANVAAVDGRIYVLGFLTGLNFAEDGRGFVYDPATDTWSDGPQMPPGTQRGASGVAVVGSRIHLVGGLAGGGAVSRCNGYDVSTDEWFDLPDFPREVDHMAAGVVDGKVVVAGGRDGGIRGITGDTQVYDPAVGEWAAVSPMPTPRGGTAGVGLDGRFYVFGGEGNPAPDTDGVFAEVEAYDLASDTWHPLEPMPTPRHGTGAAAVDGVIYVPGGASEQAFGAVDTHERYVP